MPFLSISRRDIPIKILFFGPPLAGKTACLRALHAAAEVGTVGAWEPDDSARPFRFEWRPAGLKIRGWPVCLEMAEAGMPGAPGAPGARAIQRADAVLFVADSQPSRQEANLDAQESLFAALLELGINRERLPIVYLYNKRDLPGVWGIDQMDEVLSPGGHLRLGTEALRGLGVREGLDRAVALALS